MSTATQPAPLPHERSAPGDSLVKNFAMIEFIARKELPPIPYKLYAFYKEYYFLNGRPCALTVRKTAAEAGISVGSVSAARRDLAAKGYVKCESVFEAGTQRELAIAVTPTPQWFRNAAEFGRAGAQSYTKERSPHEHTGKNEGDDCSPHEHTGSEPPVVCSAHEQSQGGERSAHERSVHILNASIYKRSKKLKRKDSASPPIGDVAAPAQERPFKVDQTVFYVLEVAGVPNVLQGTVERLTAQRVVVRFEDGTTKTVKESRLTVEPPALERKTSPLQDVLIEYLYGASATAPVGEQCLRLVNGHITELRRVLGDRAPDAAELRAAFEKQRGDGFPISPKAALTVALVKRYRDKKGSQHGQPNTEHKTVIVGGLRRTDFGDPNDRPISPRYLIQPDGDQHGLRQRRELHPAGSAG